MASSTTDEANSDSKIYELKEQLLLLTTLVATVTYVSGLNLPGGAWESGNEDGHLAGDPILRDTHYRRYLAFYYCNATALASSLVVCLILVMLRKKSKFWTVVLQAVMVLDLLGLMGSYIAGSCRDTFTTIWALVLACPILAYITYAFLCYLCLLCGHGGTTDTDTSQEKEKIEVLMLLATFAVTITYAAGLNPPGGFWSSSITTGVQEQQHQASDPIMEDRGPRRYRAFFICNTTAFVASLLIILLLLDKKLSRNISRRFMAVYLFIAVALLGLMGAYAAGSCREVDNTLKVLSLAAAVPACVCLQLALAYVIRSQRVKDMIIHVNAWLDSLTPTAAGSSRVKGSDLTNTRYFVMVLASLAVSITYQAGLDPPGGLWQDGHKVGHPVLQTTHPARYKVFFYSNSAAFVTSLVVVMMVQSRFLLKRRTLLAAMVLDLIGLVVAFAAGSTRDTSTSIYVVAIVCLVLSYAVIHIALGGEKENIGPPASPVAVNAPPVHAADVASVAAPTTPTPPGAAAGDVVVDDAPPAPSGEQGGGGGGGGRTNDQLEDKRQVLLIIAILVAALTYQAGLTPPGGFWPADDDQLGHRAGYPILLQNYPRRYKAFFYCNAASFMASVALILLLVNRKLYRPGVRCYALHVCMAVGMLGLMGAYASGSSRHLKTSIYVLTLVAAVSASILLQVVIFWFIRRHNRNRSDRSASQDPTKTGRRRRARGQGDIVQEKNEVLEYLMLLGVLIASVTYQTGLKPPGGIWQQDNVLGGRHFSAGNPILHDISKRRYDIFFYSNSASFMASIIVIVTLLPLTLTDILHTDIMWPLWPVHTAILMDMLGLLVAYAAGSTRKWESSRNVIFLILPVLAYIVLYAGAAAIYIHNKRRRSHP